MDFENNKTSTYTTALKFKPKMRAISSHKTLINCRMNFWPKLTQNTSIYKRTLQSQVRAQFTEA